MATERIYSFNEGEVGKPNKILVVRESDLNRSQKDELFRKAIFDFRYLPIDVQESFISYIVVENARKFNDGEKSSK